MPDYLKKIDFISFFDGLSLLTQLFCILSVLLTGLVLIKLLTLGWNELANAINKNDLNNERRHEDAKRTAGRGQAVDYQTNDLVKRLVAAFEGLEKRLQTVERNQEELKSSHESLNVSHNEIKEQLASIRTSLTRLSLDNQQDDEN